MAVRRPAWPVRAEPGRLLSVVVVTLMVVTLLSVILAVVVGQRPPNPVSPVAGSRSANEAAHGRIARLLVVPFPEGTTLRFARPSEPGSGLVPALADIQEAIPEPLPLPIPQRGCTSGYWIKVEFEDGATVEYGPCDRPASVERLDAAINALLTASRNPPCPVNRSACPPARGLTRAGPVFPHLVMRPAHARPGTLIHLTALNCLPSGSVHGRRGRFADSAHLHGSGVTFSAGNVTPTTASARFRVPVDASRGLALFVMSCAGEASATGFFNVM